MKELNLQQLENLEGGRVFWGYSDWNCGDYGFGCACARDHFVFWVYTGTEYSDC